MLSCARTGALVRRSTEGRAPLLHRAARLRFVTAAIAALASALVASACVVPVAGATTGHRYSGQFGNGQLLGPGGVAIDQSSGSVFVADSYAGVVAGFNAGGDFVRQWDGSSTPATYFAFTVPTQVATDGSAVYVANSYNNAIEIFNTNGAYQGELDPLTTPAAGFNQPSGVAVDPGSGDVYVANTNNNVIDRFDSSGTFIAEFGTGDLAAPTQLAVDSAHDVYVLDSGNARVVKYSGGSLASTVDSSTPTAVAVDSSTDHVFVADVGGSGNQIAEYASDGTPVATFGSGRITAAGGIAVNAATGRVYVGDTGAGAVETFNEITLPTVATTPGATAVDANDATVAGTVNPEGVAGTTYHFEYGIDTTYGTSSPNVSAGGGSGNVAASATLSGLVPGVTYHFRVVGVNAQGSSVGGDETFTTDTAQVTVDGQPAFGSAITTGGATLNGTLNPNGAATTYHFDYGLTAGYGSSTPGASAGGGTGDTPVTAPVAGLQPATTYHFRVVADNGIGGTVNGADTTFTTAPATPATATDVSAVGARLHGTINPRGSAASSHFEYGLDTNYGTSTVELNAVPVSADVAVDSAIQNLAAATVYHFRVVATIGGQTVSSDDATFTTVAAPEVTANPVTDKTPTTATLNATVDTHGAAGTLTMIVTALDSAYGSSTPVTLAAQDGSRAVSAPVGSLPPGADYVVRAAVTAAGVTSYSDLVPFSTPASPSVTPPAPPAISANPYGCVVPHLDAVNSHPKAGTAVTVTGTDLGVNGSIALGDALVPATTWSATAITFTVPSDTMGTQPLTVNCGAASNTVGLAVFSVPSNTFSITKTSVKGSTASLSIKVPGPGKVETSGPNSTAAKKTITKASTVRIAVHLSKAGKKALAKAQSKKLSVTLRVRFTPAGGTAGARTTTIAFKRGGSR
jgi:DNA-binding beta-propeller fold protein YncE